MHSFSSHEVVDYKAVFGLATVFLRKQVEEEHRDGREQRSTAEHQVARFRSKAPAEQKSCHLRGNNRTKSTDTQCPPQTRAAQTLRIELSDCSDDEDLCAVGTNSSE